MPTITYKIKYRKNEGLVFSPSELLTLYLYGITIQASDGSEFDLETTRFYIKSAQKEIEDYLQIKFDNFLQTETLSYYTKDYYQKFPFFQTKYPVKQVYSLIGLLGRAEQVIYPTLWFNVHKDSDGDYPKQFSLVPTGYGTGVTGNADVIITGILRDVGLRAYGNIPNYWNVQYTTGYDIDNVPYDLLNVVGKLASIGLFNVAGDIALGQAALANYSLSIDGLSQSIGTTNSATNAAFGARIINYKKEVLETLKRIKLKYRGFNVSSM